MEVAALALLLSLTSLDSASARVSPTVSPPRAQFFKYDSFSVSCEEDEPAWRVMKRTPDGEVRACGSSCHVAAAFPTTDSGEYWCVSGLGETSTPINVSVTAGSVVLEAPVLPVVEGANVTLRCRHQVASACGNERPAVFYKDGLLFRNSSTGTTTLSGVSRSDEGLYSCDVCAAGGSPESRITVRGKDPPPLLSVSTVVRHLLVGAPFLVSTIIMGLVWRDTARGRKKETNSDRRSSSKTRGTSDDVIVEVVHDEQ